VPTALPCAHYAPFSQEGIVGPSKPAVGERPHTLCPLMRKDEGCRSEPRSSKRYEAFLRR
jgi:hypothetical protein